MEPVVLRWIGLDLTYQAEISVLLLVIFFLNRRRFLWLSTELYTGPFVVPHIYERFFSKLNHNISNLHFLPTTVP